MSTRAINRTCLLSLYLFLGFIVCEGLNKYSIAANAPDKPSTVSRNSIRELEKPFRMAKLNLLWSKAKYRLTETKLQSLFSDLRIHDKEELDVKHLKSDGQDLDGLKEASIRKKLIGIMSTYDLLEHFADTDDPNMIKHHKALNDGSNYVSKHVFGNQKLNQLWTKAEFAGFTVEELAALKEEFTHHQEKVDEYMSLLANVAVADTKTKENSLNNKLEAESWNMLDQEEQGQNNIPGNNVDYVSKANLMREKHIELKNGYDHLERLTSQGPKHKEFVEPKVQNLWRVAQQAKFSQHELASLKEELRHYERRLLKLRHLHATAALGDADYSGDFDNSTADKSIKKHVRTVEKLHLALESKIMQKHIEL